MLDAIFGYSVTLLVLALVESGDAIPVVEYDKGLRYEEYIVEHEISSIEARNSAMSIDLSSITPPPGCQNCTAAEMSYCRGKNLINDHCCCDRRFREVFPFIPHTCYLGTQICKPVVKDCAEYSRLRTCCCDKYVLQKWKEKTAGAGSGVGKANPVPLVSLLLSLQVSFVICKYLL